MNEKLSLSELQLVIRDSIYTALPGFYWVTAEISEIKENYSGHCYLELIEKNQGEENVKAKIKAVIWSKRYGFLKALFENMTGSGLTAGLKVLLKVKVEYHEIYGISLVINDIDPSYTLGEMALKRVQIIRKLEEEGVFGMNRDLSLSLVPRRIAIISSANAAGYSDFIRHLEGNRFGYKFMTALFESPMQGIDTEKGVVAALMRISENMHLFDAVAIIRGGGSQTDLSWFDNYEIAYNITQFPLPVITGIGHEKDLSVTDMVAFRSEKTPTAVADFLVGNIHSFEENLMNLASEIASLTREAIMVKMSATENYKSRIRPSVNYLLTTKSLKIAEAARNLMSAAALTIERVSVILDSKAASLKHLDPENVLKRGYTITFSNGKPVTNVSKVKKGDRLETRFSDGTVESTVESTDLHTKE